MTESPDDPPLSSPEINLNSAYENNTRNFITLPIHREDLIGDYHSRIISPIRSPEGNYDNWVRNIGTTRSFDVINTNVNTTHMVHNSRFIRSVEITETERSTLEYIDRYPMNLLNSNQNNTRQPIYQIPRLTLTKRKSETNTYCPVCIKNIKKGRNIWETPCKHLFHIHCINKWLDINNTCPICRYPTP